MAIERDVIQAVATSSQDTKVRIANTISKYPIREFSYENKESIITIDASSLEWSNYFKCGYKGILEKKIKDDQDQPKGMLVLVDGTVPPGSGLSSSAAFVCSSALAVMQANQYHPINKKELTEIAIVAERNVGVNSGGMDQAASVLSEKNYALHVEFVPELNSTLVKLPDQASFVIAHTLVTADKFTSGPRNYNLRVVETKLGAKVLAKCLQLKDAHQLDTYKQVTDAYFLEKNQKDVSSIDQLTIMLDFVQLYLTNQTGYTLEEMADAAGMSVEDVKKQYMTRFPVETDLFRLYQRAVHVFSEAKRVIEFIHVCEKSSSSNHLNDLTVLEKLGDLMNASFDSCIHQFDCSCPELNQVCSIARKNGAFGARLTGAGWGGASVFLTTKERVPTLIQAIKKEYYHQNFPELTEDQLNDAIFPTEPCSGAIVFTGFDQ
ncbi:unnamed protein product [Cunninghamella blakesleeana]